MSVFRIITSIEELLKASSDKTARYLILRNDLEDVPCFRLMPFQSLVGEFDGKSLKFLSGADGIRLSKGNELKNLKIQTDADRCAIFQDEDMDSMGTHHLSRLNIRGMVRFIIGENIRKGRIDASFIHISEASPALLTDRPNRFGVDMLLGAFTLWNRSENPDCVIEADITHFSCGSEEKAIQGSGLVICGTEPRSGSVKAGIISTGHIYTNGEIGEGIADTVAAGVAVGYATEVENITDYGRISATGANEMGIYNWGKVDRWHVTDCIITKGNNGCGFINAGIIDQLVFTHEIETFGTGARGLYMFEGVIKDLNIDKITTHGDAASGIQFDRFIERMCISKGVETFGNSIDVKFADSIITLGADGIFVNIGGTVRMLKITGEIITHGRNVHSIYNRSSIEKMLVSGKILATGEKSVALEVNEGYFGAENVIFISEQWAAALLENAKINNCHELTAKGKDFDLLVDIQSSVDKNIIAPEFIEGIFQKDVRIEYTDNVDLTYRNGYFTRSNISAQDIPDPSKELGEGTSGGALTRS